MENTKKNSGEQLKEKAPLEQPQNTVEPVKEPERSIDINEAKERLGRVKKSGQEQFEEHDLKKQSILTNTPELLNQEQRKRDDLMRVVNQQFKSVDGKYLFKDGRDNEAFRATDKKLTTQINDVRASSAMAKMAKAQGWEAIKVSGHRDFKKNVWLEASALGVEVVGYRPSEKDLEELRQRLAPRKEKEERDQSPLKVVTNKPERLHKGVLLDHGSDHYNHDPKNGKSYFVEIMEDGQKRKLWGQALETAVVESKAKKGDEITLKNSGSIQMTKDKTQDNQAPKTKVNHWEMSINNQITREVAEAVIDAKTQDETKREVLKAAINERLEERQQNGQQTHIKVYDQAAPSRSTHTEREVSNEPNRDRSR